MDPKPNHTDQPTAAEATPCDPAANAELLNRLLGGGLVNHEDLLRIEEAGHPGLTQQLMPVSRNGGFIYYRSAEVRELLEAGILLNTR